MKKTKTLTNEERIKRIRAMSQDKFDSKIADLLAEAAAAAMAVQALLEERKAKP